jgi:shikimate kinase/3-dehydroquinate synthase
MDLVLVGLPGSGKSVVGRRLAARRGATFVDLDAEIERSAGVTVAEIFASEGERGFRARERVAIAALGDGGETAAITRVIAAGGGALVDPRNRWHLLRGRRSVWLDVRPEVAAQRLRNSRHVRPLVANSADPIAALRRLAADRERFYAATTLRIRRVADPLDVANEVARALEQDEASAGVTETRTVLLRAETAIGRFVIGTGIAARELDAALASLDAARAIVISEPRAWAEVGGSLADDLRRQGRDIVPVILPTGEDAKRLEAIERAARELARVHAERSEPLVAIGGGAVGDAAGFLASIWLRGVPVVHVPTTLVAQIDSSIGGKTGVDLPEAKNLLGTFHQPAAVIVDVDLLRSLDRRQRRAALGEAAKMAVLGDERLFALLEVEGSAIADGDDDAWSSGAVAELVERCLWAKVEVVLADERETLVGTTAATGQIGRIALNLGHTIGHALEAATGFGPLLHGEAVAYGLRAAARIGTDLGVTPPDRAARLERLLDRLELATEPIDVDVDSVVAATASDKKRAAGAIRWILPTSDGVTIRSDVPEALVGRVTAGIVVGSAAPAGATGLPA